MKDLFKNKIFKVMASIMAFLFVGALIAAANGHGETAQSTVVGTVFAPCHYVAQKISNGLDRAFGAVSGNAEYEKKISELQGEVGELRSQLVDYENLKRQNELYQKALELNESNDNSFEYEQASVIGRDSADIYHSFTLNKGMVNGVKVGDAVVYGEYIIGVVEKSYTDYSVVRTILDPDFSVSAYEIVSNEISYVTGTPRLARDGYCKLANLTSSTKVSYGSIICTAGISGTVPKGLIIGTVKEISDETTDISSYAIITPGVDIDSVSTCFVITNYDK